MLLLKDLFDWNYGIENVSVQFCIFNDLFLVLKL